MRGAFARSIPEHFVNSSYLCKLVRYVKRRRFYKLFRSRPTFCVLLSMPTGVELMGRGGVKLPPVGITSITQKAFVRRDTSGEESMGSGDACGRERAREWCGNGAGNERGANPSIGDFFHYGIAIHTSNADILCSTARNTTIGANVLAGATWAFGLFNGLSGRW